MTSSSVYYLSFQKFPKNVFKRFGDIKNDKLQPCSLILCKKKNFSVLDILSVIKATNFNEGGVM